MTSSGSLLMRQSGCVLWLLSSYRILSHRTMNKTTRRTPTRSKCRRSTTKTSIDLIVRMAVLRRKMEIRLTWSTILTLAQSSTKRAELSACTMNPVPTLNGPVKDVRPSLMRKNRRLSASVTRSMTTITRLSRTILHLVLVSLE